MSIKTLVSLKSGESGVIAQVNGGYNMVNRLASMGIRQGSRVIKLSNAFMNGPVTIEVDRTQIALGYGIARRVLVSVGDDIK